MRQHLKMTKSVANTFLTLNMHPLCSSKFLFIYLLFEELAIKDPIELKRSNLIYSLVQ